MIIYAIGLDDDQIDGVDALVYRRSGPLADMRAYIGHPVGMDQHLFYRSAYTITVEERASFINDLGAPAPGAIYQVTA